MNKSRVITVFVVVVLVACLFVLFQRSSNDDKYAIQKNKIDSLSKVIAGLENEQVKYDSIIKNYEGKVDTLSKEINQTKDKLAVERKKHGKKIDSITKYNVNQLDSFFTNRYR